MAVRTETRTIDGHEVMVRTYVPTYHVRLQARLLKLIAPTISPFFKSGVDNIEKIKQNLQKSIDGADKNKSDGSGFESFSSVLDAVADHLNPDDFIDLILSILKTTHVDNQDVSKEDIFNSVFSGEEHLIYKVVFFALEVNFASFLSRMGIGSLIKRKGVETEEAQKS